MDTNYKHIFFDLDRTLWDFEANAKETFKDLYKKYDLKSLIGSFDQFYALYRNHNDVLWRLYREKQITKEKLSWYRFHMVLSDFNVNDEDLARAMGADYLEISKTKTLLFPHTHEILAYLKKKYPLHIITNGFEEVQFSKLKNCNLEQYFTSIITSEKAGVQKPKPEIFNYALDVANASKEESIMIGDDMEVDVKGADQAGIDQVHFNFIEKEYDHKATYEINSLIQLKDIL